MLTKTEILNLRNRIDVKRVDVGDWGSVVVRPMSSAARESLLRDSIDGDGDTNMALIQNFQARVFAACVCDEAGNLLFGDDDIGALADMPGTVLDLVVPEALEISGLGARARERAEKNFETTPS